MCTAGLDCKFCSTIESCPRVAASFPTADEERAAKGNRRGKGAGKVCVECGAEAIPHKARCLYHQNIYYQAHYAKHRVEINERKRASYHANKARHAK